MSKPLLLLLIIACRILRVMDQHIRPLNEAQKPGIATVAPLNICRIDHAPFMILNTIDNGPIQRMTITKLGQHAHFFFIDAASPSSLATIQHRFCTPATPRYALLIYYCMKRAMGWKFTYIYREIRWRHQWSYELFNTLTGELRSKKMQMRVGVEEGREERKTAQVITMCVRDEE